MHIRILCLISSSMAHKRNPLHYLGTLYFHPCLFSIRSIIVYCTLSSCTTLCSSTSIYVVCTTSTNLVVRCLSGLQTYIHYKQEKGQTFSDQSVLVYFWKKPLHPMHLYSFVLHKICILHKKLGWVFAAKR